MTCTLAKCWPGSFHNNCSGPLEPLSNFSDSPAGFLQAAKCFSRFDDNPEYRWQIWLSYLTGSTFSDQEISCFLICKTHKVHKILTILCIRQQFIQEFLNGKFSSKNVKKLGSCSLCPSRFGIRRVTYTIHRDVFQTFGKIVPVADGNFENHVSTIFPIIMDKVGGRRTEGLFHMNYKLLRVYSI